MLLVGVLFTAEKTLFDNVINEFGNPKKQNLLTGSKIVPFFTGLINNILLIICLVLLIDSLLLIYRTSSRTTNIFLLVTVRLDQYFILINAHGMHFLWYRGKSRIVQIQVDSIT